MSFQKGDRVEFCGLLRSCDSPGYGTVVDTPVGLVQVVWDRWPNEPSCLKPEELKPHTGELRTDTREKLTLYRNGLLCRSFPAVLGVH